MTYRADPAYPVIWTDGPACAATVAVSPTHATPAAFVAAVRALVSRYGGGSPTVLVRDVGADRWSEVVESPGPAVEVTTDQVLVFRFEQAGEAWTTTVAATTAPDDVNALARIAAHVNVFLTAPDDQVDHIDHRTPAERALFDEMNRTGVPVPEPLLLHRRVELTVDRSPERTAVVQGDLELTYARLDGLANALAARLVAAGTGPGRRVGVVAARSATLVVAAYAVLKTGAAYVPLDPLLPRARQETLHRVGRVDLLVVESGFDPPDRSTVPSILLDPVLEMPEAPRPAPADVRSGDLAYVIFTSGSTGEPKGALLHHLGSVNTIGDLWARIGLGPGDSVLAVSSPSFDMTVSDIFGALMAGAAVVLPDQGRENDVEHWAELVARQGVTAWHSVPSSLGLFLNAWQSGRNAPLRAFLVSGDWVPLDQPASARRLFPGARFVTLGGTSEVSVDTLFHEVDEVDHAWRSLPYGRPMANQTVHVLDAMGRPAAIDQVGELYLGGIAVGLGYQDRPALTAERFVPDPFPHTPGARMYRTGDLVRLRSSGDLELVGRVDQQVKVGGVRVDLGEVEACLRLCPGVAEAVVVAVPARGGRGRSLAGYVVPKGALSPDDVRRHVGERLPAAMVPARLVVIDRLPLNANGKVARRELAERPPDANPTGPHDVELVMAVGEIWREVLGLAAAPAAHESFLALGGGSLAAIQVAGRLNRRFATDIKVTALVDADTVAGVAEVVRSAVADPHRRSRPALTRRS